MGTKIEANAFPREYHSVIDLDGSTSNAMKPFYHENKKPKNDENPVDSFASCDLEKVRQTILKHESIFRYQLEELHHLYGRQRELMNQIRKDDVKAEKCRSSYLFPLEDVKRSWNPYRSSSTSSMARPTSSTSVAFLNGPHNLGIPADVYNRDNGFCLRTSQHQGDALNFDLYCKRNDDRGERNVTNRTDGVSDRLVLLRGETSDNLCSNFSLVTKDFFQNCMDKRNGIKFPEKRRFDGHSSVGNLCSNKPQAFPQSLLSEPKREFSNCPLDIGASVSRKRKKIFGVEIGENEDPFDAASDKLSSFDHKPHDDKNHHVFSLESSSWISNPFAQTLDVHGSYLNGGEKKRFKADLKGEISSQKVFSDSADMKGKWSGGYSSVGLNFIDNVHNINMPEEGLKKDPEHTQKFRPMIPENCRGLPWFLRNSQVSDDLSKDKKSSYFMNLDSLQNCSQKFFGKSETSAPMAAHDAKDRMDEGTDGKKILGFPISNVVQSFNDLNSEEDFSKCSSIDKDCDRKVENNKGLNDYISDMRHCIDLNLSLVEEDAPSSPSLREAVVKIATTEMDLEAPAVNESETDATIKEVESKKMDVLSGMTDLLYQERDKIAAEAMIAISLSMESESVDDVSLKWFAEIASLQCGDSPNSLVDVMMNQSRASDDEEEEELVPDGMDYFEFMTLKLADKGEKHYHYEPFALSDDEAGPTQTKRSRRGLSRRGRQRKDFQRDILPGLITLSRLELKEDFQAFEELLKAEGGTWRTGSSVRNGRGRKRLGGANTRLRMRTICSTQEEQLICRLEERSLAGWGRRTRRVPRQRCPNAPLSTPVKC